MSYFVDSRFLLNNTKSNLSFFDVLSVKLNDALMNNTFVSLCCVIEGNSIEWTEVGNSLKEVEAKGSVREDARNT